jgi:hypothetical protein
MRTFRKTASLIVPLALVLSASALQAEPRRAGVAGKVFGESAPLVSAQIYAYQLADSKLHKVMTDGQGNFLFQELPAGLYKIIAHKSGFVPVVVLLTRTTAQAYQFVELQLAQRQKGPSTTEEDFWSVRSRLPADVLRDIDATEIRSAAFQADPAGSLVSSFKTQMQALTGVDQIGATDGQRSGGDVGIQGQLGQVQVGLHGSYVQLNAGALQTGPTGAGQASSLFIDLERGPSSRITLMSHNNRMTHGESGGAPVDFEHYGVNWSQEVGANGRSEFGAHYTAENNFYRHSLIPLAVPEASRSWRIEGAYTNSFSDRSSLQAGLRYRERQFGLSGLNLPGQADALSAIDVFSRGGVRVQPAVLVEYGLYSTLADGSLALTPQGGLVLQLGSDWQLETSASHRVYADAPAVPDFLPTLFQQRDLCEQGAESCYQVNLSRQGEDDSSFTFGAIHRTVGDTLRLYFSDDFFDRLESLYLVRGDEIPEVRFGFSRRILPQVVTTLDSSLASGGGGTFFAADGLPYENQVRYLVASLDTQFLGSSTGVFLAFHRLEQQLDPMGAGGGRTAAQMEYERLQLNLNQNLNFLLDLASDWAIQLNMELSRGGAAANREEVRHRILGGIAVKF